MWILNIAKGTTMAKQWVILKYFPIIITTNIVIFLLLRYGLIIRNKSKLTPAYEIKKPAIFDENSDDSSNENEKPIEFNRPLKRQVELNTFMYDKFALILCFFKTKLYPGKGVV